MIDINHVLKKFEVQANNANLLAIKRTDIESLFKLNSSQYLLSHSSTTKNSFKDVYTQVKISLRAHNIDCLKIQSILIQFHMHSNYSKSRLRNGINIIFRTLNDETEVTIGNMINDNLSINYFKLVIFLSVKE